jgi:hypothetical protein
MSKVKQTTKKNTNKIVTVKSTILKTGEKVPDNTWYYIDKKGNVRYTDFYQLINRIAGEYDNAALREGRKFSTETIEFVKRELIESGREIIPNIGSLTMYLNTIRLREIKKTKGGNEVGYQFTQSHIQARLRVTNTVGKKK